MKWNFSKSKNVSSLPVKDEDHIIPKVTRLDLMHSIKWWRNRSRCKSSDSSCL